MAARPDGFSTEAPQHTEVQAHRIDPDRFSTFLVEYMASAGDFLVHLYRKAKSSAWPIHFPNLVWAAMIKSYHLGDPMNELRVEYVPEFHGWCLILFGQGKDGSVPAEYFLTRALDEVERAL
jgi:hypothetical protein